FCGAANSRCIRWSTLRVGRKRLLQVPALRCGAPGVRASVCAALRPESSAKSTSPRRPIAAFMYQKRRTADQVSGVRGRGSEKTNTNYEVFLTDPLIPDPRYLSSHARTRRPETFTCTDCCRGLWRRA